LSSVASAHVKGRLTSPARDCSNVWSARKLEVPETVWTCEEIFPGLMRGSSRVRRNWGFPLNDESLPSEVERVKHLHGEVILISCDRRYESQEVDEEHCE